MITFQNDGLIDIRAVTTFGVSSKENENPIGYFGTGLKYAIAVLLREGCTITIYRGEEEFKFAVETARIRKDEFNIITMNGQPLAFTTRLGQNWELWQAFREIYCNMLDEGGDAAARKLAPHAEKTTIQINGPGLADVWSERHKIVLPPREPLYIDDYVEIYPQQNEYLYYRGVRVYRLERPSVRTYNIIGAVQLTEDRTLASIWAVRDRLTRSIMQMTDTKLLREVLTAHSSGFESTIDYDACYWVTESQEFNEQLAKLKANPSLNSSAKRLFIRKNPEVSQPKSVAIAPHERADLNEAIRLCQQLGYEVTEFPVVLTDELPDGVLGQVITNVDKIFLSRRVFTQGVRMIAGTLLEEHIHLKYGLRDESRELQNHLLDALMGAAERLMRAEAPVARAA